MGEIAARSFTESGFTKVAPTFDYPYCPFKDATNEIRLLRYKGTSPRSTPSRLCFEVITIQCPSSPDDIAEPFYAVSYTWGTVPELARIILDGHEVDVPYSSEVALKGLITAFERGAGDGQMLIWIDAICMNQADKVEKAKQVSLMGRLYSCAHTVQIWLGPAGVHTVAALQALEALKNEREAWYQEHGHAATPPNGDLATPIGCNWEALNTILAVPWFTRVWTIQEIVLARPGQAMVFIGPYTIPWDDFAIAAQWAWDTHRDVIPKDIKSKNLFPVILMMRVKMRFDLEGGVKISRLLLSTISRGATKEEDRIYGLLGMRPKSEAAKGAIKESYDEPLSERYMAAAATIMETEESLFLLEQMAILNRVGHSTGPDGKGHWPTWVPRLDIRDLSWGYVGLASPVTSVQPSNANNKLPATIIRSTPSEGLLHVQGLRIGTVESTCDPLNMSKHLTTRIEADEWCYNEVSRHFSNLWTPEFITENSSRESIVAVADSLTVGTYQYLEDDNERLVQDFGAMMRQGWQLGPETDRNDFKLPEFAQEGNIGDIARFVEHAAGGSSRFRLLKLSDGRFGMGPDVASEGDVVVILLGVNSPMILRPQGERYSLVGVVYVSGVMEGEYMRNLSQEEISGRLETFDIC